MIRSSRRAFIRSSVLFWAAFIAWLSPAAVRAQEITTQAPSRTAVRQQRREALDDIKFKLKRALRTGEPAVWPGLWTYPRECPTAWVGMPTPGLVTKVSYYLPGETEPHTVDTWQYDRQGNPVLLENRIVSGYGSPAWGQTQCAYDQRELQKGKLVYMTSTSSQFPNQVVYSATYNALDRVDVETEEFDQDRDGISDEFGYTRYLYDSLGLLVEQVLENDVDGDGTIDYRAAAMATYDAKQRMQRLVMGRYDRPGGIFLTSETLTFTIDDTNRSAELKIEVDFDLDGVIDMTSRTTVFKDEAGRDVRWLWELDDSGRPDGGGDGQFDSVSEERDEYDASGNLGHQVYETIVVDSWGLPTRDESWFTYDKANRLIRAVRRLSDLDGSSAETTTTTYTRDQHGQVVDELEVFDYGWLPSNSRIVYRYDALGNLLEKIESRWVANEAPEPRNRYTYEYAAGQSGQDGGDDSTQAGP
jgi:hypothetical protein